MIDTAKFMLNAGNRIRKQGSLKRYGFARLCPKEDLQR